MTNLAPLLSSESDDWYTPREVLDVVEQIAPIVFDPFPQNWDGNPATDGFDRPWNPGVENGLTFCNWPYSRNADFAACWAAEHPRRGEEWHLVGLAPCRPDTQWFTTMREHSLAVAFWHGRIKFERGNGKPATTAPFPSAAFYSGPTPGRFCDVMTAAGHWAVRL